MKLRIPRKIIEPGPRAAEAMIDTQAPQHFEFDPHSVISDDDWAEYKEILIEHLGNETLDIFAMDAATMLQVFPEIRDELNLEDLREHFMQLLRDSADLSSMTIINYIGFLSSLIVMYPDRKQEILEADPRGWEWVHSGLERLNQFGIDSYCDAVVSALRIYPNHHDEITLDQNVEDRLLEYIHNARAEGKYGDYSGAAANFCILFPGSRDRLRLGKSDRDAIIADLNDEDIGGTSSQLELCYGLMVLSSEKAIITDTGLDLTPSTASLGVNEQLPDRNLTA